jgi:hypothetical protein
MAGNLGAPCAIRRLAAGLGALAIAALTLTVCPPALAHPHRPAARGPEAVPRASSPADPATSPPASPAPSAPAGDRVPRAHETAAVVAGLAALAVAARWRRAVALELILIAGTVAFESGVHSVHHLGSPREMAQCAMAVAASNVPGTVDGAPVAFTRPALAGLAPPEQETQQAFARSWPAWRGRAPPALAPA